MYVLICVCMYVCMCKCVYVCICYHWRQFFNIKNHTKRRKCREHCAKMERCTQKQLVELVCFVCFGSVPAFVPRGQLLREDLRRALLPPRPLVTPGPRCSTCSLSPHTYCHASCIRSVPSPVLLSYTDILPSIWSAPSLSSCPTHIINPHTYEPLKPTYKLCYLSYDEYMTNNVTSMPPRKVQHINKQKIPGLTIYSF